ncbi:hypothetical protein GE061_013719 [Apolygus lucorum]|uniref:3-dehydrosphinganine reductase n=1 Tax=Apolygus lucorum TaxID=248454 RepID=A0A8S9XNH2_APOLU|nr:hypothetical protein GE061_013719 [Apolygus lucorum]
MKMNIFIIYQIDRSTVPKRPSVNSEKFTKMMDSLFQLSESVCCLWYIIPGLIIVGVFYDYISYKTLTSVSLKDKHVLITGGSSGIGKSFACEAARKGANVTLVARDKDKLKAAELEVKKCCIYASQRIFSCSVDVSGPYDRVEDSFADIEKDGGPIFMLTNFAGAAVCGVLEDTSPADIRKMLDLNCLGSIQTTRATIEGMKSRGEGHIILTSSLAGLFGIYGFCPYSAAKFALKGFAEALYMEVKHSGLKVTLAFPADVDTPGFAEEEKSKPKETRLICQSGGLFHPDVVARKILNDSLAGYFTSYIGLDGFLLTTLNAGMSQDYSFVRLLLQVFLTGPLRLVAVLYQLSFFRIIKKCREERNKSKKAE